ncbi:hypothetical protein [Vibrio owensii]|uniref:hypothetical protein n=1 Tax=Vibrio owensii TaxID=696485 RepID=UPI0018F139E2|nr:hypothetical protein [Vibrio owensii]
MRENQVLAAEQGQSQQSKSVKTSCPDCCYSDALLEPSGHIYCVYCESGMTELEMRDMELPEI